MRTTSITSVILIVLLLAMAGVASATVPRLMSFQGKLTNNADQPLSGNYNFTFRMYGAATGGAAMWTEVQNAVAVETGIYNVLLGSVTPLNLAFDTGYWMSVEVGADGEMSPRYRLSAAPYVMSDTIGASSGSNWRAIGIYSANGANSISLALPSGYAAFRIVGKVIGTVDSGCLRLTFNGDAAQRYSYTSIEELVSGNPNITGVLTQHRRHWDNYVEVLYYGASVPSMFELMLYERPINNCFNYTFSSGQESNVTNQLWDLNGHGIYNSPGAAEITSVDIYDIYGHSISAASEFYIFGLSQ